MNLNDIPTSDLRAELIRRNADKPGSPDATVVLSLLERAAPCYGLLPAQIMSKRRDTSRCHVRWVVCTALAHAGWLPRRIASAMGCDRGTVANALLRAGDLVAMDRHFLATLMMLRAIMRSASPSNL